MIDGILFDSFREAQRYLELKLLLQAKEIRELSIQKKFQLIVNGDLICRYIADFTYWEDEDFVIEDVKGVQTEVFRLKWKLIKVLYPDYVYRLT